MTWMIWGHPHDLGHLHMIHIHKLGGGYISVDAKTLQRQQQQPAAMEKMRISFNIFYIARWLHILYITYYDITTPIPVIKCGNATSTMSAMPSAKDPPLE